MPGGAASVARGGATAARPEDAMAMVQNPAGLAFLPGNVVLLDLDAPFQKMCVDPYGYYGWGVYNGDGTSQFGDQTKVTDPRHPTLGSNYSTTPLGAVCNSAPNTPLPQAAWAGRISKHFALGFGSVAPVLVPGMQFGGADGTVQTPYGPAPTPTRYSLIKQEVIYAAAPTFAAAYRIIPELAAGFSLQILSVAVRSSQIQSAVGGTQPSTDMLATLTTQDLFVPALTFSVHARPVRWVNLTGAFKWSDDFRGTGDVTYETNTYYRGPGLANVPFKNKPIRIGDVDVPLPWELSAGARFSGMLSGAKEQEGDPMATERWDVEVDFAYTLSERASLSTATVGQSTVSLITHTADGKNDVPPQVVKAEDIPAAKSDQHLKNSYALRVGGSYSVLPKRFAVNFGAFYESRGVDLAYADITTFAFQRIGMGTGLTFRFGPWDLRLSAAHILSETVELAPPPHQPVSAWNPNDPRSGFDKRVGGFANPDTRSGGTIIDDPSAPSPSRATAVAAKTQSSAASSVAQPNRVINAGRYTASFDILSVGVAYHF
jgi:hypothetical protein